MYGIFKKVEDTSDAERTHKFIRIDLGKTYEDAKDSYDAYRLGNEEETYALHKLNWK